MLYVPYVIVFSLFSYAVDMSTKKIAYITDRVAAKKAKAYIYGSKDKWKLAAVKKTNLHLEKNMASSPKDEHTSYISITSALMVAFRLTLFVLYLYMVGSFIYN
jgi:hypothetical protein